MRNILSFAFPMIFMASVVHSAELVCQWNGDECNSPAITQVTQQNEAITVSGKPSNYVNTGTKQLNFYKTKPNINYIPTRLFSVFPYLLYFATGSSSSRLTLVTNAFTNCNSLNVLCIQDAKVVNVPEGFAQTCTKLIGVQLINAGVETLDKNAFKGLVNLREINMRHNKISCLPPELFRTVPNIGSLFMENNTVNALDKNLFRNLPRMGYINLSNNKIKYVPLLDFTGTALSIQLFIFLERNPVHAIKPDICDFLDSRPESLRDGYAVYLLDCFLVNSAQTQSISRSNCRTSMANNIQNCYANWTSAMDAPVKCGTSCPWSSIWQQILDYLKTQV
ncbi:hypothetical protein ACKWTF_003772 [Chironomus riparius]